MANFFGRDYQLSGRSYQSGAPARANVWCDPNNAYFWNTPMDFPATFFAAQTLMAAWSAEAVDPQAQRDAIKFAVSSIEYVCLDAKNPQLCGEQHWNRSTGRELVDLVDDTKRRRRAGRPGPREVAICQAPYKMTARDGCQ